MSRACHALRKSIHFLADELALTPDASALVGQAGTLVTRLAGGLATWARRLEFSPFRLRVIGTAGSGQDATRGAGNERRRRARPASAICRASTGRWPTISRAWRRPRRRSLTIINCATGLRAMRAVEPDFESGGVRSARSDVCRNSDRRALAIRRADRRRRAGTFRSRGSLRSNAC